MRSVPRGYIMRTPGGRVEYLHRDPASRRRRRKAKSQIWNSKIWSQGTRTRERLRWKGPAAYTKDRHVLSSERAPHKNDSNCQTVINIWGSTPRLTDSPSVAMWLRLWLWAVVSCGSVNRRLNVGIRWLPAWELVNWSNSAVAVYSPTGITWAQKLKNLNY
jgi:hypothetical protein